MSHGGRVLRNRNCPLKPLSGSGPIERNPDADGGEGEKARGADYHKRNAPAGYIGDESGQRDTAEGGYRHPCDHVGHGVDLASRSGKPARHDGSDAEICPVGQAGDESCGNHGPEVHGKSRRKIAERDDAGKHHEHAAQGHASEKQHGGSAHTDARGVCRYEMSGLAHTHVHGL